MPKEITSIHVMVHPHYWVPFFRDEEGPLSRMIKGKASNREIIEARQSALNRFYRKQIERIKKKPGALLVFIKTPVETEEDNHEMQIADLVRYKIDPQVAKKLYADKLIYRAKIEAQTQRMRKQAISTYSPPKDVGKWLANALVERGVNVDYSLPVEVFGELRSACVDITHESLKERGFTNAKVADAKSTE